MLGLLTPIAAAAVFYVAQTTRGTSVEPTTSSGFWAVVVTAIVGYVWKGFEAWRDHQWRLEAEAKQADREKQDAEYKAADIAAKAEIARLVQVNQELVAKLADETKTEIKAAIAENTEKLNANTEITKQGVEINKEAIKVANNFNEKLAQSRSDLAQGVQTVAAAAETVAAAAQQATTPPPRTNEA